MRKQISKLNGRGKSINLQRATNLGMAWGFVTGESQNVDFGRALAVSGIHNVISLLEEVEHGELQDVDFSLSFRRALVGVLGGR
ncbi:MAG: hypothetical protein MZV70_58245 [Desulfobacterales bacterium]|nr:hypothetical protein [Desulfobacterales bacterium]